MGLILNLVFSIADPLAMKLLIDKGLIEHNFKFFIILSIAVTSLGIAVRFGFLHYNLQTQKIKNKIIKNLSLRMFESFYKLPYKVVIKNDQGYFISRVFEEPLKIAKSITEVFLALFMSGITVVGALSITIWLSWELTVSLLIIIPIIYKIAGRFKVRIKNTSKEENEAEGKVREVLGRSLISYRSLKIFDLYPFCYSTLVKSLKNFLALFYFRVSSTTIMQTLSSIFLSQGEFIVLIAAGYFVLTGRLTIGGLMGFMSAFWKVIGSAQGFMQQYPEVLKLNGYVERLEEFEKLGVAQSQEISNEIELEDVSFSYDNSEIIKDLNLKIKERGKILISGPNGSGKSTLANIFCGFLKPQIGKVKSWKLEDISASISPFNLPKGSLEDLLKHKNLTEREEIYNSYLLEKFELEDEIKKDPNSLSTGQRKKFEVLMTLSKGAELYIFDEPLASIDDQSRNKIMEEILKRTRAKTLIVIMHNSEKYRDLFDRNIELS